MAYKLQLKYPDLGSKTGSFPHFYQGNFPWIFHLSQGGLCVPSEQFMQDVVLFEKDFVKFHGTSVDRGPDVFNRLCHILQWQFGTK